MGDLGIRVESKGGCGFVLRLARSEPGAQTLSFHMLPCAITKQVTSWAESDRAALLAALEARNAAEQDRAVARDELKTALLQTAEAKSQALAAEHALASIVLERWVTGVIVAGPRRFYLCKILSHNAILLHTAVHKDNSESSC